MARLTQELEKLNKEVERVEKKLSNPGFVNKAPENVVQEEQRKKEDYIDKREKVEARINELKQ
jgi:valyl-tRNA synthetase